MPIPYVTAIDPAYGTAVELTPLVRRVVANNPGRFTFTGTGSYIVGRGQVAIIDPGPDDTDHVGALLDSVAGEEVTHIVVTHTHRDHSPASRALQTETGAPIYGFGPHPIPDAEALAAATPTTWSALEPTDEERAELRASMSARSESQSSPSDEEEGGDVAFSPDVEVAHGDQIQGGTWTLQALHTPGHISNHLCFGLREERAVFTGDHVMGWSTSVIPSPEGSMAAYMTSLDLLLGRSDHVFYPTHGPPIESPEVFVSELIAHRRSRETQILDQLSGGPKTIPQLVTAIYTQVPHILHMSAGYSVYSHLVYMAEKELVTCDGFPTADSEFTLA